MPKGGRKGGSVFPRVSLKDAIGYARKLVSKTHTTAQPKDVILVGVMGAKGGTGEVRISALKQYGFLKGDTKANFSADKLAKSIVAAPTEEVLPLYREAMLKPSIFKKLFDTFHGDTVSKAKLKQRAADLGVHPDETATCVELYVSGMATAELVEVDGEQVKHIELDKILVNKGEQFAIAEQTNNDEMTTNLEILDSVMGDATTIPNAVESGEQAQISDHLAPRAVFNVNVTLDSSLDIEKLQRQLELLKRFGAI